MALNGGLVQASGSRNFGVAGVQLGGNVTLSASSTVTWDEAFQLGSATRQVTFDGAGNQVISGVIEGEAGVGITFNAVGAGRVDVSNVNNTFDGPITLLAGEVRFSGDGSFGAVPGSVTAGAIVIDGGRLATAGGATFELNSNRGIQVGDGAGTAISTPGAGELTYNGVIADKTGETGSFAKQGGGTLTLGGISTYSGTTFVNNGTLKLAAGNNRLPTATVLSLGQAASNNTSIFDLNGFSQTLAGLVSTTGNSPSTTNTITSASAATLTLGGSGTYVYGNGTAANSGVIAGAISVVKTGSGTQVFGDDNTYTGATTVLGGTLVVNGSLASSTIAVASGGSLKGSGALAGTVAVASGATISPGNSIESMEVGGLSLTHGSNLVFEFRDATGVYDFGGGNSGPGFSWDLIDLGPTGVLDLGDATAANKIDLHIDSWKLDNSGHGGGSGDGGNFNFFDPNANYEWLFVKAASLSNLTMVGDDDFSRRFQIIDDASAAGVFDTGSGNPFTRPMSSEGQGTFSVAWKNGAYGTGLYIQYSAVPEPGSMILAGLASMGAGWYGRRRLRRKEIAPQEVG